MKEVKAYLCSVCGKVSTSKSSIQQCEENHVLVDKIVSNVYDSLERYPHALIVKFNDGTIQTYDRRLDD